MVNLFDDPNTIGDIGATDALQPQEPASRLAGLVQLRRSATDRTRQPRAEERCIARDIDQREKARQRALWLAWRRPHDKERGSHEESGSSLGACAIGLTLLASKTTNPHGMRCKELGLELAPHIKQLTAGCTGCGFRRVSGTVGSAVKVELDKDSPHAKDPTYIGRLTEIIQSLKPDHYKRLMYVDQLRNLCKYERQSVDVDYDFSLDQELEEKGLSSTHRSRPRAP